MPVLVQTCNKPGGTSCACHWAQTGPNAGTNAVTHSSAHNTQPRMLRCATVC